MLAYTVYLCENCIETFELPEKEREQKPTCPFCNSENVKKLFTHNKRKPSPFS